jgi:hypothetical protein
LNSSRLIQREHNPKKRPAIEVVGQKTSKNSLALKYARNYLEMKNQHNKDANRPDRN